MAVVTFSCPECGKELKSSKPRPVGAKIKCPTCAAVFPMPAQFGAGEGEGIQPSRQKEAVKRRSGGKALACGCVAVAMILLLAAGGGVGAYFFLHTGVNLGSGNEEPLAYVPPGTEALFSVDCSVALSDPALGPQIERGLREHTKAGEFFDSCKNETGLELKELFANTLLCTDLDTFSQVVRTAMTPPPPPRPADAPPQLAAPPSPPPIRPGLEGPPRANGITLILRPSRPFDQQRIVKAAKHPVHLTAHDKHYFEITEGSLRTVFMPSNRTLILSTLHGSDLDFLFDSDGVTPSVPADIAELARGVNKATLSLVVPFEEKTTRTWIDEAVGRRLGNSAALQPVKEQIVKQKAAALWATLNGPRVELGANVLCGDPAAANAIEQEAEKGWSAQKVQLAAMSLALKTTTPKAGQLLDELMGALKFSADGATARATLALGRTTIDEAIAEGKDQEKGSGLLDRFLPNRGGRGRGRGRQG
jgi:hypothetical protein